MNADPSAAQRPATSRAPGYALVVTGLLMAVSTVLTWWTVTGDFVGEVFDYTVPGVGGAGRGDVWEGMENSGVAGSIVLVGGLVVALTGLVRALGRGGRLMGVLALVVSVPVLLAALAHWAGNAEEIYGIVIAPATGLWLAILASAAAVLAALWATVRR